jgi:hypothetical protein
VTCVASRLPFLFAVALVAAAIGDALVETVSNGGVFGSGFDDNNHLSVVPALVAGTMLGLAMVAAWCWSLVRRGSSLVCSGSSLRRSDPFGDAIARLAHGPAQGDVPIVVALQFAALFAMESSEQLLAGGRLLGGSAWLGGPIVFSVATHVLLGTALTLLFGALVRSIQAGVSSLVRATIEAILVRRARDVARLILNRSEIASLPQPRAPYARRIRGRAPPRPLVA